MELNGVKGKSVTLYEQHPFITTEENHVAERRTTKVFIHNLPLSVSNREVKEMLDSQDVELLGF